MKRFYNYIMVGALALATTACNDSFLERTPTNDLNDVAFWNTTATVSITRPGTTEPINLWSVSIMQPIV